MGDLVTKSKLLGSLLVVGLLLLTAPAFGQAGDCDDATDVGQSCDNGNTCMDARCVDTSILFGGEPAYECWSTNAAPDYTPCGGNTTLYGEGGKGYCIDGSCDHQLPIELSDFSAVAAGKTIHLAWTTDSEENNAGFAIQMRRPGEEFVEVGYVEGAGNSVTRRQYTFDAERLGAGTHFVRLRIVDFDGNSEYTNNLEVRSDVPNRFALNAAYPNPFNPTTTLGFVVANDTDVALRVFNSCGQEVETVFSGRATGQRIHEFQFDAGMLPSGTYFYRLETPSGSQVRMLALTK